MSQCTSSICSTNQNLTFNLSICKTGTVLMVVLGQSGQTIFGTFCPILSICFLFAATLQCGSPTFQLWWHPTCISPTCISPTVFLNCIFQRYFSTVFLYIFVFFQLYFCTVFLDCISRLYFSTVFVFDRFCISPT